jgi:hypothetical protein
MPDCGPISEKYLPFAGASCRFALFEFIDIFFPNGPLTGEMEASCSQEKV